MENFIRSKDKSTGLLYIRYSNVNAGQSHQRWRLEETNVVQRDAQNNMN